ncbi:hypothetical protein WJX73_009800 [Symbiochloris irregularis]|uniref:Xylose isomerase-like TIM barrel domain-containing protein n=1 Tax=Symbiochloris irregularis TaxID=706552 RepID=A0AAW1PCD8_9CHLO
MTATSAALSQCPVGIHSKVWVGGWTAEEAEKAIAGTKRADFDLIELDLSRPEDVDAAMTRRLLEKYELKCSGSVGLPKGADISSSDASVREHGRQVLSAALQAVHQCGGNYFGGVNYCAMEKYTQPCSAEQWRYCKSSLKALAREAADHNITWGLEVVNRYVSNILNTAQQAMEMIADVDEPNIVVHLDTLHMNIEEVSIERACRLCGSKLGYIHAGESHWGYLGVGTVDWPSLFRGLAAVDYTGPVTFESFSAAVVSETHSQALCIWRDLWTDPEDVAIKAQQFLHANLQLPFPPG